MVDREKRAGRVPAQCADWIRGRGAVLVLLTLAATMALIGCPPYDVCDLPDATPGSVALPTRLSETGLYADIASRTIAPGVREYRPRFALWSDGAEKRRWISLPAGTVIDTSDMNSWSFPVGTRLWKEFTRDGVRVETRLMQRTGGGPGDWSFMAYVWNADGSDAIATPEGGTDVNGTAHDVPEAAKCLGCHGGRASRVLGFSAIQLSFTEGTSDTTLRDLVTEHALSAPPAADFEIPGNDTERAALGYMHANCGHCHNSSRPTRVGSRCYDPENRLDFWLRVERLGSTRETPTYSSAVGTVIEPGNPDGSAVMRLVSRRSGGLWMPPLASERVDDEHVALLRAWIAGM